MTERVVLAYSGGLDTSVAIPYLADQTGGEVIAVALDVGQGGEDMEVIRKRALDCGAAESVVVDAREEFAADFCLPALRANPIRLRQVMDNVVGNAIKYSPPSGEIEVSIRAEGDQMILKVTDNGPGIPTSEQSRIFDKFYRASNVDSEVEGSGLGLAIVKTIVESHQGRIWVESVEGKGSSFFVVLPVLSEPATVGKK